MEASTIVLSLVPEARLAEPAPGHLAVAAPRAEVRLGPLSPVILAALRALAEGASEDALAGPIVDEGGVEALARFYVHLGRLASRALIRRTLHAGGARILTLAPTSRAPDSSAAPVDMGARYRLSRFAVCHREERGLVVESPLSTAEIVIHDRRGGAVLADLAEPALPSEIAGRAGLPESAARPLLGLLLEAGVVCPVGEDGRAPEDTDPARMQWELFDLWVHARSRRLGRRGGYGATYRFAGRAAALPALGLDALEGADPARPAALIPLHRPDLGALMDTDVPFTRVLEERRSARAFGEAPITAAELGALLYRAARVKRRFQSAHEELTERPSPSGGAIHEAEIHLAVGACRGLDPGLYQYDPGRHGLASIRASDGDVEALLADAARSAGAPRAQVLLVVAARFQRVSFKYEAMAYALILKDAGVLLQTLCLVAAAMGLAACPIGGGDAGAFARAAGKDPLVEGSVAELIVGSRGSRPGGA